MRELDQDSQVLMAGLKDLQKKYIQRAKRKLRESVRFLFWPPSFDAYDAQKKVVVWW